MRTVIVIILSLTIPASAYVAGCRQDGRSARTAAFPKASEIDNIARAPQDDPGKPPVIPPAPIDRSILNLPEQPQRTTMARLNAVEDHSRQIAGSQPPAGLFTLPSQDTRLAQAPTPEEFRSAPAALTPIPSAREFWSKPLASGRPVQPVAVPADVSAMMPSQPQPVLAPPSIPASAASQFMPPPGTKLLPPEDVPGVFDAVHTSFRTGSPPERTTTATRFPAPGGDALGAPLPSSQQGPVRLDLSGLVGRGRVSETLSGQSHANAAMGGGRHAAETMICAPQPVLIPVAQSIPGAPVYEPLPEPMTLDEYNSLMEHEQRLMAGAPMEAKAVGFIPDPPAAKPAAMPAPLPLPGTSTEPAKKSAIPFLPIPDFKGTAAKDAPPPLPTPLDPPAAANPRLATLLDSSAVREALAPLPDISGSAAKSARAEGVGIPEKAEQTERTEKAESMPMLPLLLPPPAAPVVAEPEPLAEALSSPGLTAAKTSLLHPVASLDEQARTEVSNRDLFRMDFWDQKPAAPVTLDDAAAEQPAQAKPEPEAAPEKPAAPQEPSVDAPKPAAPQKVKLTPIRSRARSEELGKIDAATEVPPLRF
ncbi:MAG: hypothetical protein LUE17_11780 [Planctomycetaceae bacterium]|nr:hypothetical protein [Planctomycetaceae bacterium]